MTLHAFVISWTGQHPRSLAIAAALAPHVERLTLVYSDRDPDCVVTAPCPVLKVADSCFFGGKFAACLDACAADGMLVVTGDVACPDWGGLVGRCRAACHQLPELGVWAPLIDYTSWTLTGTCLGKIPGTSLNRVVQTDSIVFALTAPVITRMRQFDYAANTYGWGIDWAAMAFCAANRLLALVDEDVLVRHPKSSSYDESLCIAQMHDFLRQLTPTELQHYCRLNAYLRNRPNFLLPPGATPPPWSPAGRPQTAFP